jgi:conjugative transposon TraM protein
MEKKTMSQAFLRKRKMMLVLPVIAIPFLTLAFYALGGGQGKTHTATEKQVGLNLNLPDAGNKEDNLTDKLSFYDKAEKDSQKMEEWMRTDPYYQMKIDTAIPLSNELQLMAQNSATKYNQQLNTSPYEVSGNSPEQKLMQKLALLEKEMNKQPDAVNENSFSSEPKTDFELNADVSKLETMMQGMNNANGEDPEIKQLGNALDKILDIQHPQRIKDKLKEKSLQQKEVVFAVSRETEEVNINLIDTSKKKQKTQSGFYTTETYRRLSDADMAIEAEIPESQILVNGAVVKMRLTTDIFINGVFIPKNTNVSGIAQLNDERLKVEVNSIRFDNSLFPVKLEVYDMDGLPGIYIPGAISRDVAKQSADDGLQLIELTAVDPTLKAQAAAAGINSIKNLIGKKVKQVKVMVKAGYKILLKDKNTQQ